MQRPTATYFAPVVGLVAQPASWIWQNWLQLQPWWPTMPWGTVTAASVGLLFGLLAQDLYNSTSWLRLLLADLGRLVDHIDCWFDEVGQSDERYREGYSTLRFARRVRNAEVLLWGLLPNAREPYLLSHERALDRVKHATQRIVLARVPLHRTDLHSTLGTSLQVQPGEIKKVIIDVRCGVRRQRIPVDVIFRQRDDQGHLELVCENRYRWAEP